MGKRRGTFNKLVVLLNVFTALLLFLASIARFMNWGILSFLSFLTLLLPHLVLANVFFLVYWGIKGKKQLWLSLSVLFFGFLTQDSFFKIFGSNGQIKKDEIKVMTFNVHGLNGLEWAKNPVSEEEIITFIKQQNADILCMQEFDSRTDKYFDTYQYRFKTLNKDEKSPQAIYSKYPMIAKGSLNFPNSGNNAIYADILIGTDTLRVYNVHLQSFSVRPRSFKREAPDRLFDRLNRSFKKQQEQSIIVSDHASNKGDMIDSFQEKGFGLGSTYDFKFLPFRIDFILADPSLEIMSHKNFNVRMSDHTPVMASFRLKE